MFYLTNQKRKKKINKIKKNAKQNKTWYNLASYLLNFYINRSIIRLKNKTKPTITYIPTDLHLEQNRNPQLIHTCPKDSLSSANNSSESTSALSNSCIVGPSELEDVFDLCFFVGFSFSISG